MRFVSAILLILTGTVLFSSCQKKVSYPVIPAITFRSFTPYGIDSAIMEVNFTDGDGDIGYAGEAGNSQPDFFIEYFDDTTKNGNFIPVKLINPYGDTTLLESKFNIPSLTPSGRNKSISGIIRINMEQWIIKGPPQSIAPSVPIRFNVWIFDRAGHKSNVLTTPEFIAP